MNLFFIISLLSDCDDAIDAVVGTVDAVEQQSVVVNIVHYAIVVVTIDAKHEMGQKVYISSKCLCHIIVELVAIGWGVHDDDGTVKLIGTRSNLLFNIVEIGYCRHIIIFCGIGVETEKFDASCDE